MTDGLGSRQHMVSTWVVPTKGNSHQTIRRIMNHESWNLFNAKLETQKPCNYRQLKLKNHDSISTYFNLSPLCERILTVEIHIQKSSHVAGDPYPVFPTWVKVANWAPCSRLRTPGLHRCLKHSSDFQALSNWWYTYPPEKYEFVRLDHHPQSG